MEFLGETICFGRYRLHPTQGLRSGKREIRITPKSLSLLRALAERSGQIVSKEELFRIVWPKSAVTDATLTSCIKELRRALHDDARTPRYIETVHRRGFRFLVPTAPIESGQRSCRCDIADCLVRRSRGTPAAVGRRIHASKHGQPTTCARERRSRRRQDDADGSLPATPAERRSMHDRASRMRAALRSRRGIPAAARTIDATCANVHASRSRPRLASLRAAVAGTTSRAADIRRCSTARTTHRRCNARADAARVDRRARSAIRAHGAGSLYRGLAVERSGDDRLALLLRKAARAGTRADRRHLPIGRVRRSRGSDRAAGERPAGPQVCATLSSSHLSTTAQS